MFDVLTATLVLGLVVMSHHRLENEFTNLANSPAHQQLPRLYQFQVAFDAAASYNKIS